MKIINNIEKYFFLKKYNDNQKKRLKNHNFTILCSNCMGGIVYHHMGERFCSPTINLWMSEPDFQKYCFNLEYYSKCKLRFIESNKSYPVAVLGEDDGITIYFLHYKTASEAEEKWNERTGRINKENLYIIAGDYEMTQDRIEKWSNMKCKSIVVFSAKKYQELPYVFYLEKYKDNNCVGKYVNDVDSKTGLRHVETVFDFVDFINQA